MKTKFNFKKLVKPAVIVGCFIFFSMSIKAQAPVKLSLTDDGSLHEHCFVRDALGFSQYGTDYKYPGEFMVHHQYIDDRWPSPLPGNCQSQQRALEGYQSIGRYKQLEYPYHQSH